MVIDDVATLFRHLGVMNSAERIAIEFNRSTPFYYHMRSTKSFILDEDFVKGLEFYGYELVLQEKNTK